MRNTLVIFSSLLAISLAVITAPESLYFYSKLESATQASDETGRVANATAVGTPTTVPGYNGNGVSFNPAATNPATDALNFPPLALAGNVTYSVWFNIQSFATPNGKVFSNKIEYNSNPGNEVEVNTDTGANGNHLNYVHAAQQVDGVAQTWALNTWYHAVVVGSDVASIGTTIYINGTVQTKTTTSAGTGVAVLNPGKPFSVGCSTDATGVVNPGGAFRGIVDEMRVYNVTLTAAQVLTLFQETFNDVVTSSSTSSTDTSSSATSSSGTSATSSTSTSSGVTVPSTTNRNSATTAVVSFFVVVCSFVFML